MNKREVIDEVISKEKGYVNHLSDSGKETNWGITLFTARKNGWLGEMKDMPRSFAFQIYSDVYWGSVKVDDILALSEIVAEEIVDTCILMGSHRASVILQRCLNVFNRRENLYQDIKSDGMIGPATITALSSYLDNRDAVTLVKAMNSLQGAFLLELAERREKDEDFIYGWIRNRA